MDDKILEDITRFEVIDQTGRVYVSHDVKNVKYSIQDQGRTLKLFIWNQETA